MKLFKATIESNNSCYVETVLVIDEDKEKAHTQLCLHFKRQVKYTVPLKELEIDFTKPGVIGMVGWGEADNDNSYDD